MFFRKQNGEGGSVLSVSMVKFLLNGYKSYPTIHKLMFDKHYRPARYNAIVSEQGQYVGKELDFRRYVEEQCTEPKDKLLSSIASMKQSLNVLNKDECELLRMLKIKLRLTMASAIAFYGMVPPTFILCGLKKLPKLAGFLILIPGICLNIGSIIYIDASFAFLMRYTGGGEFDTSYCFQSEI